MTDPLDSLHADIDATVGLMTAAQSEGAEVWVCGPEDLAVVEGRLLARARPVRLADRVRGGDHHWVVASPWYVAGPAEPVDVAATFAVAMLRIDPPVSVPSAPYARPAATAAADPPLDPPAVRSVAQGLRVSPKSG